MIPKHDLSRFKKILHEIIEKLTSRNLEEFRKRILPFIKIIREENGLSYKSNMFQKNKWAMFLHENPDIRAYWEKLPRRECAYSISLKKLNKKRKEKKEARFEFNDLSKQEESLSSCLYEDNIGFEQNFKKEEFIIAKELDEYKIREDFSDFCSEPVIKFEMISENEMLKQESLKEEFDDIVKIEGLEGNSFQDLKEYKKEYEYFGNSTWDYEEKKQEKIEEKEKFASLLKIEEGNELREIELNYKLVFWG